MVDTHVSWALAAWPEGKSWEPFWFLEGTSLIVVHVHRDSILGMKVDAWVNEPVFGVADSLGHGMSVQLSPIRSVVACNYPIFYSQPQHLPVFFHLFFWYLWLVREIRRNSVINLCVCTYIHVAMRRQIIGTIEILSEFTPHSPFFFVSGYIHSAE